MNHIEVVREVPGPQIRLRALPRMDWMANAFRGVETWKLRHNTRRHLTVAEAHVLKDVGISEAQRFIEASKPFWER